INNAENPDRKESKDPNKRKINAPKDTRLVDGDRARRFAFEILELGDERLIANENSANRLARGGESKDAKCKMTKLPCAELRLLDMEAHDVLFDFGGCPIPGPSPQDRWGVSETCAKPTLS